VPLLCLASASPRRLQLLQTLGVSFTVIVSDFDEGSLSHIKDGAKYVQEAARAKARVVAERLTAEPKAIVLGVDTDVVAPDGQILGKPANPEEARAMLEHLSNNTHIVYSGVAVLGAVHGQITHEEVQVVATRVTFATLTPAAIAAYIATGEPFDKAGGYGMQGNAMAFVEKIEGDPSNVIGLPLVTVAEMLTRAGVVCWEGS
jgi:septum formation protein